jgi:hypothetical protein
LGAHVIILVIVKTGVYFKHRNTEDSVYYIRACSGRGKPEMGVMRAILFQGFTYLSSGAWAKCQQCWKPLTSVGESLNHPAICASCIKDLDAIDRTAQ